MDRWQVYQAANDRKEGSLTSTMTRDKRCFIRKRKCQQTRVSVQRDKEGKEGKQETLWTKMNNPLEDLN